MSNRYLLDSSAVLTLLQDEEGAGHVDTLIQEGAIYLSFASLMEITYRLWQLQGEQEAQRIYAQLLQQEWTLVESSSTLAWLAAEIKAQYKLSFADAWIVATAIHCQAILVHKDPEFEAVSDRIQMDRLPYKTSP